jgi:acyl-CoA-binding protein
MDIREFSKLYTVRCNTYHALKAHYLKKLTNSYELFNKCFPDLKEEIELDYHDIKGLYDYCENYEDDLWKILNGKIQDAKREEVIAFVQKPPNKIFEDRVLFTLIKFSLFRNKLLRR